MLVGTINKEYLEARERAQRLLKNYIVRFINKWFPKGTDCVQMNWRQDDTKYCVTVRILKDRRYCGFKADELILDEDALMNIDLEGGSDDVQ